MKETMNQKLVLNDLGTMWSPSHRSVRTLKKRQIIRLKRDTTWHYHDTALWTTSSDISRLGWSFCYEA